MVLQNDVLAIAQFSSICVKYVSSGSTSLYLPELIAVPETILTIFVDKDHKSEASSKDCNLLVCFLDLDEQQKPFISLVYGVIVE